MTTNGQEFHFESGRSVKIRRVSHYLVEEVYKQLPPPEPPEQTVTMASGQEEVVKNFADPDFMAAWNEYEIEKRRRIGLLLLRRGTEFEVDVDAVKALRADMAEMGVTIPGDDRWVHLYYLCVGSQEEENRLVRAILGFSQPTEEAVATATDTFQG